MKRAATGKKKNKMSNDELVVVYTSSGMLGAEVIKEKLQSEGIDAMLKYESAVSILPLTVDGLGQVQVLVRAEDEVRARRSLK
jgi:putative signal transducing protein